MLERNNIASANVKSVIRCCGLTNFQFSDVSLEIAESLEGVGIDFGGISPTLKLWSQLRVILPLFWRIKRCSSGINLNVAGLSETRLFNLCYY